MKKVSADTITELSGSAAASPGVGGTPPTTQQMIDQIRGQLTTRIESLSKSAQHAQKTAPPQKGKGSTTAFKISYDRAVEDLQEFENIVAKVPNGFRLAPVLYTTIKQDQNAHIYDQFGDYVRPQFMRYLAEKHAGELSALGICQQGIDRMEKGLDPVDPNGRLYDVNIDHIIERFGGGKVSLTKEVDPLMPAGSKPTYLVNHFSNFILLPTPLHDLKNSLNELQRAANTPYGQSKWILMMVPEVCADHSGYVAQPQGQLLTKNGNLRVYHMSSVQTAASTASQVRNLLESMAQSPEKNEKQKELLKPVLEELSKALTTAFNDASKPRQDFKAFKQYYEGEKFQDLREKINNLPAEETAEIRKTLLWIDNGIAARFNQKSSKKLNYKNDNNKASARNKPKQSKPVVWQQQHVPNKSKQKKRQKKHGR